MLEFDTNGYLKPYEPIKTDLKTLQETFAFNEKRQNLLSRFEEYLETFRQEISEVFVIWINGSFVTRKLSPNDIDFVIFLDYVVFEKNEKELMNDFRGPGIKKAKKLDVYFVVIYPKNHKYHLLTLSDTTEYLHLFTKTKSKNGRRYDKGFLELNFE